MRTLELHFDGSISNPNPGGLAAFGFHVSENKQVIEQGSGAIGSGPSMSNNYAEFFALHKGLERAKDIIAQDDPTQSHYVIVKGDSALVIQIMNKRWRQDSSKIYYPACELAFKSLKDIRSSKKVVVTFDWIPRENNTKADELSRWQQFSNTAT